MTFVEKHRFSRDRSEAALLRSWEAELFGGMFEALAERYSVHADELTACATMELFNVHYCEAFGHAAGVHVSLEQAERLGREGAWLARHQRTFDGVGKLTVTEITEADDVHPARQGSPHPRTACPRR